MSSRGKARTQVFEDLLSCNEIDIAALRKVCFHGIPDSPGVRPLCWKLLLGESGSVGKIHLFIFVLDSPLQRFAARERNGQKQTQSLCCPILETVEL